jgi:hypothetical protein
MLKLPRSTLSCTILLVVFSCVVPLLLSPIFILFGVDTIPTLVVSNHAEENLILIGEQETHRIPSNTVVEVPWPTSNKILRFRTDNNEEWIYKWIPTREPFYQHRQYYIQMEPDRRIYALPFLVASPTQNLPSQPDGYPLTRRMSDNNNNE